MLQDAGSKGMTELYKANYILYAVIGDDTDDIGAYSSRDEAVHARREYLKLNPHLNMRDDVKIRTEFTFVAAVK